MTALGRITAIVFITLILSSCAVSEWLKSPANSDMTKGEVLGENIEKTWQFLPPPFNFIALIGGGLLMSASAKRKQ